MKSSASRSQSLVAEVDGSPRSRGSRWLCRARGVWRRGGSGEASVAAGGRAAAPGRVQVDDAPALDAVGASWKNSGVQVGCPKTPVAEQRLQAGRSN